MFIRLLTAILLPPVSLLLCGRPVQAFFNLVLCIIAIPSAGISLAPAIVWSLLAVVFWRQDRKSAEVLGKMRRMGLHAAS